ncbi:MAG TPA: hypothetical protein VEH84_17585 [Alphaproteobacteria bacterium]|nr:hypothetical protein [Alphaproteobacteria bacterium]
MRRAALAPLLLALAACAAPWAGTAGAERSGAAERALAAYRACLAQGLPEGSPAIDACAAARFDAGE